MVSATKEWIFSLERSISEIKCPIQEGGFSKEPSVQNMILFLWPFHHPYDMLQEILLDQDYVFLCVRICFLKSVTNQHSKPWTANYSNGQWQHRADKILIQFTPKNHIKLPNLLPNLTDTMWSVTYTEHDPGQKGTITWSKVSVEDWTELRKQNKPTNSSRKFFRLSRLPVLPELYDPMFSCTQE